MSAWPNFGRGGQPRLSNGSTPPSGGVHPCHGRVYEVISPTRSVTSALWAAHVRIRLRLTLYDRAWLVAVLAAPIVGMRHKEIPAVGLKLRVAKLSAVAAFHRCTFLKN